MKLFNFLKSRRVVHVQQSLCFVSISAFPNVCEKTYFYIVQGYIISFKPENDYSGAKDVRVEFWFSEYEKYNRFTELTQMF